MSSQFDLSDKKVVVSGACGGIGRTVVHHLMRWGASVVANDILETDAAQDALGIDLKNHGRMKYVKADATTEVGVSRIFDIAEETFGMPNVVACHAGMVGSHRVDQYPVSEFDQLIQLNIRSNFLLARHAAQTWVREHSHGSLIFTTSWVQDVPWPGITPYASSKAALHAMMRGFARELAPHGIRANAVAPGIVGVGMAKRQWDTDPDYRHRAEKAIPLGVLQSPDTVAHAFGFLCSEFSEYMTGSVLLVDGGCSLYPMD